MSDEEIVDLIDSDEFDPMLPILAIAVTGPNAIACWSSALFVAGVVSYIYENTWQRTVQLPELCCQLLHLSLSLPASFLCSLPSSSVNGSLGATGPPMPGDSVNSKRKGSRYVRTCARKVVCSWGRGVFTGPTG